jgi:superoxide reductase
MNFEKFTPGAENAEASFIQNKEAASDYIRREAEGEKFPYQLGRYEFNAHGGSVQGPNTSSVYTHPAVMTWFKTGKAGTLMAVSYCNIHGLWQSSKEIKLK